MSWFHDVIKILCCFQNGYGVFKVIFGPSYGSDIYDQTFCLIFHIYPIDKIFRIILHFTVLQRGQKIKIYLLHVFVFWSFYCFSFLFFFFFAMFSLEVCIFQNVEPVEDNYWSQTISIEQNESFNHLNSLWLLPDVYVLRLSFKTNHVDNLC